MAHIEFTEYLQSHGRVGVITLNRASSLHALTYAMTEALSQQLLAWERDRDIHWVLIRSVPGRFFCAGGDIREIYEARAGNKNYQFFKLEYQLNYLIARYSKPYVVWIDGTNLGGGVGLAVHGALRLASANTKFAMPETAIGFYPDVGTTYWLSRLPDGLGMYIALTGVTVSARDLNCLGWIDYVIKEVPAKGSDAWLDIVDIMAYNWAAMADVKPLSVTFQTQYPWLKDVFTQHSFDEMLTALSQVSGGQEILQRLSTRSPLALRVTWAALEKARTLSLADCLQMEYQLTCKFLAGHDFYEGIRALLIDKDKRPNWSFATLSEITPAIVTEYFDNPSSVNLFDDLIDNPL